jgi:hypothetical protein
METDMRMEVSRAMGMVLLWRREKQGGLSINQKVRARNLVLRSLGCSRDPSNRYTSRDNDLNSSTRLSLPSFQVSSMQSKKIHQSITTLLFWQPTRIVATVEMWDSRGGRGGGRHVAATIYFY